MGHGLLGSEACESPQLSHHLQEAGPSQLTSLSTSASSGSFAGISQVRFAKCSLQG